VLVLPGFAIGVSAGLRSMTPVAVIACQAQYHWPGLHTSASPSWPRAIGLAVLIASRV
jgi:uncharacterized membrane protein